MYKLTDTEDVILYAETCFSYLKQIFSIHSIAGFH